ncbi:hypothetical protein GGR56DRAFT_349745 [Xylariaceae sp. FL0804]|nr:hypothetical protein GGR56DRAFT_349745 [Xylariaceae sp. FL0804]
MRLTHPRASQVVGDILSCSRRRPSRPLAPSRLDPTRDKHMLRRPISATHETHPFSRPGPVARWAGAHGSCAVVLMLLLSPSRAHHEHDVRQRGTGCRGAGPATWCGGVLQSGVGLVCRQPSESSVPPGDSPRGPLPPPLPPYKRRLVRGRDATQPITAGDVCPPNHTQASPSVLRAQSHTASSLMASAEGNLAGRPSVRAAAEVRSR